MYKLVPKSGLCSLVCGVGNVIKMRTARISIHKIKNEWVLIHLYVQFHLFVVYIQGKYADSNKNIYLTLNLLTTTIVAPPSNAIKWQMGFNSAFKGLKMQYTT
jgi:hypothetical protein